MDPKRRGKIYARLLEHGITTLNFSEEYPFGNEMCSMRIEYERQKNTGNREKKTFRIEGTIVSVGYSFVVVNNLDSPDELCVLFL